MRFGEVTPSKMAARFPTAFWRVPLIEQIVVSSASGARVAGHKPDGRYYVAVYPYPGGYGGSAASDGLVNGTLPSSMAGFHSVEMSEHRYPIRFEHLAMREDSSGAGRHRGGCGTTYAITALDHCLVSVLGDRVDHAPFGVNGGGSAKPNAVHFDLDGETWTPPMRSKAEKVRMSPGDTVHLVSPGGGGFGGPVTRDLAAVEQDLVQGVVSPEIAQADYGVRVTVLESGSSRPNFALKRST